MSSKPACFVGIAIGGVAISAGFIGGGFIQVFTGLALVVTEFWLLWEIHNADEV
jgi:hypothetical protein